MNSGPVYGVAGERWDLIDNALRLGQRGLAGNSSLARLLARKRGLRNPMDLPPLDERQILEWARIAKERTGSYPGYKSGSIMEAPGETWAGIDYALRCGKRNLPGGSSLARLLARHSD